MGGMDNQHRHCVAIFADQDVGLGAVQYVLERYPEHVKCVVTTTSNEISSLAESSGCQTIFYDEITQQSARAFFDDVEVIFLAWWPRIIPTHIIDAPRIGVVNFHPSLLPYNRGKHYNFWTIVEGTPFGVTLHFVDEGIDSGDILFQTPIEKTWEDTGQTLYVKAKREILALFQSRYLDIVEGRYQRKKQDTSLGRLHYARELEPASQLHLDQCRSVREVLNLLRARTFEGKPACYFQDGPKRYEVRVSITEVAHGAD
jgi:methionyl-tRNA formyltransferase